MEVPIILLRQETSASLQLCLIYPLYSIYLFYLPVWCHYLTYRSATEGSGHFLFRPAYFVGRFSSETYFKIGFKAFWLSFILDTEGRKSTFSATRLGMTGRISDQKALSQEGPFITRIHARSCG